MNKRTWIIGAVAAALACTSGAAMAQDATTPDNGAAAAPAATPGTGTTPDTGTGTTPMATPAPMTMPAPIPMPQPIDYRILLNKAYTYQDLQQAKYNGLSQDDIATIAKISQETGASFNDIYQQVLNGATFPQLASEYNMSLNSVYDVSDMKDQLRDYKQAYRTTGWYALRNMQGMDTDDNNDMSMNSNGSMTGGNSTDTSSAMPMASGDIIGVAESMPQLSTFVKAVQAAGLVSTLQGAGPFTVFAPDNRAFKKLPKGALSSLMANPTQLMNVLEYHVIQGQSIDAATAMSMTSPTSPATLQGGTLNVTTANNGVMVNGARVVKADVQASNGIIHVINQVLMPPAATTATTP